MQPPQTSQRSIRSFVTRQGRTTPAQAKALQELGSKYIVPYVSSALIFENTSQRTIFEIGFGMGEATAQIAASMPDTRFLCCDVHLPGVGALLLRLDRMRLDNVRIVVQDAVDVLDHMLPEESLDGVHIFFPDPWPKARHHKRRLIQPHFVHLLALRLKRGGYVHCATDWEHYAEHMLQVLSAEPKLKNTARTSELRGFSPKPDYRPMTKFENRGVQLGHQVWDLVFQRVGI